MKTKFRIKLRNLYPDYFGFGIAYTQVKELHEYAIEITFVFWWIAIGKLYK